VPESLLHHVFPEHVGMVEVRWFTGPLNICSDYREFEETEEFSIEIQCGAVTKIKKDF